MPGLHRSRALTAEFGCHRGVRSDGAGRVIELSGHRRSGEIDIVFTGVRPGEKLFEELQYGGEAIDKTRHPKIFIGKIAGVPADLSGPEPGEALRCAGCSCEHRPQESGE